MEIITAATNWAKAEITSALFFMLFGVVYILVAIGFKQVGTGPLIKALFIPMLLAGGLLLIAGVSFYVSNKSNLTSFETDYKANPSDKIKSELATTTKTINTYENVALKVFPAIILVSALIAFFISIPIVRAICIAVIAFLSVLVLLDSQALKRMKTYHQHLEIVQTDLKN